LQESSSEFGGDDLDDEFLELADTSMDPFVELVRTDTTFLEANTGHNHDLPSDGVKHAFDNKKYDVPPNANEKLPNKTDYNLDIDEFDDDFEEFSDNIDDILAGCDETPSNKFPRAIQQQPPTAEFPLPHNDTGRPPTTAKELQNDTKENCITSSDEFDDDDFDMDCLDEPIPQGEDSLDDVRHS
jgi:hypothetical protein